MARGNEGSDDAQAIPLNSLACLWSLLHPRSCYGAGFYRFLCIRVLLFTVARFIAEYPQGFPWFGSSRRTISLLQLLGEQRDGITVELGYLLEQ